MSGLPDVANVKTCDALNTDDMLLTTKSKENRFEDYWRHQRSHSRCDGIMKGGKIFSEVDQTNGDHKSHKVWPVGNKNGAVT